MNILTERDRNRLVEYRNELSRFAPEVIVDLILSSGDQARERSRFGCSLNALYLSSGIVLPKFMVERLIRWLPMWFLVVAQSPIKFLHEARKLLRVVFMNGGSAKNCQVLRGSWGIEPSLLACMPSSGASASRSTESN